MITTIVLFNITSSVQYDIPSTSSYKSEKVYLRNCLKLAREIT